MTTKEQIMREAGRRLNLIFARLIPTIRSGTILMDIDLAVGHLLREVDSRSALKMMGFPGNISISLNEQVVQGKPDGRVVRPGDLVSLDMTLYYQGFFVDKATSFVITPKHYIKTYLVNAVNKCLETAIMNAYPSSTVGEIGRAIEYQASLLRVHPARELYGHYIGEEHHMKPLIPNYSNGSNSPIREGDFIALEPIVFYGPYVLRQSDHEVTATTLSAHVEETVYISGEGAEIIT